MLVFTIGLDESADLGSNHHDPGSFQARRACTTSSLRIDECNRKSSELECYSNILSLCWGVRGQDMVYCVSLTPAWRAGMATFICKDHKQELTRNQGYSRCPYSSNSTVISCLATSRQSQQPLTSSTVPGHLPVRQYHSRLLQGPFWPIDNGKTAYDCRIWGIQINRHHESLAQNWYIFRSGHVEWPHMGIAGATRTPQRYRRFHEYFTSYQ